MVFLKSSIDESTSNSISLNFSLAVQFSWPVISCPSVC